jgi:RNase P/RNase MRP subunit p30
MMNRTKLDKYIDHHLIRAMEMKLKSTRILGTMLDDRIVGYTYKQRAQLWSNLRRDLRRAGYEVRGMVDGSILVYL